MKVLKFKMFTWSYKSSLISGLGAVVLFGTSFKVLLEKGPVSAVFKEPWSPGHGGLDDLIADNNQNVSWHSCVHPRRRKIWSRVNLQRTGVTMKKKSLAKISMRHRRMHWWRTGDLCVMQGTICGSLNRVYIYTYILLFIQNICPFLIG